MACHMQHTTLPYRISNPPAALRKAKLDNIALVPASLLPLKGTYQPIANRLPKGSVLCVETASPRHKWVLEKVAQFLRSHGRQVVTLPFGKITRKKPTPQPTAVNLKLAW